MMAILWAMAALAASAAPVATEPSFCQRMAADLPMKEKRVAGTKRAFDMQTMTGQPFWSNN